MFDFLRPSANDLANRAWATSVPNSLVHENYDVIIALHDETVPIVECVTKALAQGTVRLINSTLMVVYGLEDIFRDKPQRHGNGADNPT